MGGVEPEEIKFKRPGAHHHARWLAKAIYCLKIFLFKDVFFKNSRNSREVNGLRDICIFVLRFYLKAWFTSQDAIKAPNHDLTLLQELMNFESVNPTTSKAAIDKLKLHFWYLNEQTAALSFFDSTVPLDVKKKMVEAIQERQSTSDGNVKRIKVNQQELDSLRSVDISYFITKASIKLFELYELPYDFLFANPEDWEHNASYNECLNVFKYLRVVNDVAERCVALTEQYNQILSRDESMKQNILQVVHKERKTYPTYRKRDFIAGSSHSRLD